jgi:hypothetical protein
MVVGDSSIYVASLADIIKMKKATNRPRDRAVLDILEQTLEAIKAKQDGETELLRKQNDWLEREMIRRRVALPLGKRINFLRKRIGICCTSL